MILRYGQIAARLVRMGYQPIPLYPESKRPAVKGWPQYRHDQTQLDNRSRPYQVRGQLVIPDYATGIVTGEVLGLDVDVREAKLVRKLKLLADRMLGPGPDRVGAPPKFLRVYRAARPFKKMRSRPFSLPGEATRAKGYKPHAIEVLADGQQFVCEAIHNQTKRPYQWSVLGGLLVTPVSSLTVCTEAQFRAYLFEAEQILIGSGATECAAKTTQRATKPRVPTATWATSKLPDELRAQLSRDAEAQCASFAHVVQQGASDPATCRAALAAIPNADEDYELWWRVGLACAAALGESGRKDFIAWSRKSAKHDAERTGYTDTAYSAFLKYCAEGKSQISAGSIFHLAKQAGWTSRGAYRGVSLRRWHRAFNAPGVSP